jgi:hypothetical protein
MDSYQPSEEAAASQLLSLPFPVTAYLPDESGKWRASLMPTSCPTSDGDKMCCVTLDYHRARKTGPCVPVAVLKCSTHGRGFTLYPCGHVPYGREAVAPVGLDGVALKVPSSDPPSTDEACAPWRQTRYAAVFDAALGKAWSRGGPGPYLKLQLQRLEELAALLGLAPAPPAALGEQLALLLDVPRLRLLDDTGRLAAAVDFEARGAVLVDTLQRASTGRCILERVLACGALAGLWCPVHLWRTPGQPQRTVFPGRGVLQGRPM